MMDGLAFDHTHVEQPLAEAVLSPDHCRDYDALVFYDMPGIRFGEGVPQFVPPTATFVENFTALLNEGKGMVFYTMRLPVGLLGRVTPTP